MVSLGFGTVVTGEPSELSHNLFSKLNTSVVLFRFGVDEPSELSFTCICFYI